MDRPISRLGTTRAGVRTPVKQKGRLRTRFVERDVEYLTWTIDGVPLLRAVGWPDGAAVGVVTPVRNGSALGEYEADYLRAILGEEAPRRSSVMPDGRVPLLVWHLALDLAAPTLTADVVRDDETVAWRDIEWQVAHEPVELSDQATSLFFEREQYDDVVGSLLAAVPGV